MRKTATWLCMAAALALGACASMPVAEQGGEDARIAASFAPVKDKGVIYIYWGADSQYGLYAVPVSIGDAGKVDTSIHNYVRVEVAPGSYTLEPHTAELTADVKPAHVTVKAGDVKFVRMTLKARFMLGAKGELAVVPAEQAKKEIKDGKLTPLKVFRL